MPVVSFGVTVNIATGDNARIVLRTGILAVVTADTRALVRRTSSTSSSTRARTKRHSAATMASSPIIMRSL